MTRILIFCDSKWRDLPGIALVKYHLEKLVPDAYVQVSAFNLWKDALNDFVPHLVVLNHTQGKRNKRIASHVKRHGGMVAAMSTEGIVEFDEIFSAQKGVKNRDMFLCWNDEASELIGGITVGCPRFDFYRDPLKKLIDTRQLLCDKYHLDSSRPIVTFGDSWPNARFAYEMQSFHRDNWSDLGAMYRKRWGEHDVFAKRQLDYQNTFRTLLSYIKQQLPDVQILVKPHPMSDQEGWQWWGEQKGIGVLREGYIFDILNGCDVFVSKLGSTTIAEAWLLEIPAIKMNHDYESPSSDQQRAADDWNADNIEDARIQIERLLTDPDVYVRDSPARDEYLRYWGLSREGAGEAAAENLSTLLPDADVPHKPDLVKWNQTLAAHDEYYSTQRVDGFGNWDKTTRQKDVLGWQLRITQILG